MANQVVKVKRESLEACMTCPLCNKLLKEATTLSLCLHTFCRKCIYEKLSDEEVDCCPVCNIVLGVLPVEKLRPDHNLQDIRAKIFPFKSQKVRAPKVLASVSLPAKRKERSLSSLVVSSPKVSVQTGFTVRRIKTGARKAGALHGCSFTFEGHIKKEDTFTADNSLNLSSPDSSSKTQGTTLAESSRKNRNSEDIEDNVRSKEGKVDLWTPLNCLVEAANRTKSSKIHSRGNYIAKSELPNVNRGDADMPEMEGKDKVSLPSRLTLKSKLKDNGKEIKLEDDKNETALVSGRMKSRRLHPANNKRYRESEMSTSTQVKLDVPGARSNRKMSPIWFSLVASENQKGDVPLPQVSSCYLRIKDGSMPVSSIRKYLAKKLNLAGEAEVEVMCRGQPVVPSLQLHNLVDLWFRSASTKKLQRSDRFAKPLPKSINLPSHPSSKWFVPASPTSQERRESSCV